MLRPGFPNRSLLLTACTLQGRGHLSPEENLSALWTVVAGNCHCLWSLVMARGRSLTAALVPRFLFTAMGCSACSSLCRGAAQANHTAGLCSIKGLWPVLPLELETWPSAVPSSRAHKCSSPQGSPEAERRMEEMSRGFKAVQKANRV